MPRRPITSTLLVLGFLAGGSLAAQTKVVTLFGQIGPLHLRTVDATDAERALGISADSLKSRALAALVAAGIPTLTEKQWIDANRPPFLVLSFTAYGRASETKVVCTVRLELQEYVSVMREEKWQENQVLAATWNAGRVCAAPPALIVFQIERDVDSVIEELVKAYQAGREP